MTTQVPQQQEKKPYPEWAKMPGGYNFSTRGFNWTQYNNDFLLRTDAVWEKVKMKDWFRAYFKIMFFDKAEQNYQIIEPDDIFQILYESYGYEDFSDFAGFTPTGRTNAFQIGLGPKQRIRTSAQTNFIKADYFDLCCLRFEKWLKCDQVFHDIRGKFDYNIDQKNHKSYPCFREFSEVQYACSDDTFDYLLELMYAKRANDTFSEDHAAWELTQFPTAFDTPDKASRKVYTY